MWLRILRGTAYPGLSKVGPKCNPMCPYKTETEESLRQKRKSDVATEYGQPPEAGRAGKEMLP